jgi:DNA mismatch repair protein MSH5
MPRNAPAKTSFQHKDSSASLRTGLSGSSQSSRTLGSFTSRSRSVVNTGPRSRQQIQRVQVVQSSSRTIPSDIQQGDTCAANDDVTDDTLSEVIMAVDMTPHGTVGCCYYVAREEKLYFMEDIQIGNADIIDTRKCYLNPGCARTVLTNYSEDLYQSHCHSHFDED